MKLFFAAFAITLCGLAPQASGAVIQYDIIFDGDTSSPIWSGTGSATFDGDANSMLEISLEAEPFSY